MSQKEVADEDALEPMTAMTSTERLCRPRKRKRLVSQNRPNYKSSSVETIDLAIKFLDLSRYNPGSQPKSQRTSNELCSIPRS